MTLPAAKKPAALLEQASCSRFVGRRELVRSLAGLCLLGCRHSSPLATAPPAPRSAAGGSALRGGGEPSGAGAMRVTLWSWFDLPDDPRSRELSGIAWDEAARTLWAVQDATANIVPLIPDANLMKWGFGPIIPLKMSFPLDLEGIVVTPDGFLVASEKGPRILDVDRKGTLRKDLALPSHFEKARDNKSLESLTMSPDGIWLFTTSEGALSCDGEEATTKAGTRVRILRMPRGAGETSEHAYTTDPAPHPDGDYGIADLCALSMNEVLVLERGWARGYGNTARIYDANLASGGASCLSSPALQEGGPVVAKRLVVDLSTLPAQGLPAPKQKQATPLLDNFEGLALGPRLPDGRQTLVLVSDDNGRADQFARVVVLALG